MHNFLTYLDEPTTTVTPITTTTTPSGYDVIIKYQINPVPFVTLIWSPKSDLPAGTRLIFNLCIYISIQDQMSIAATLYAAIFNLYIFQFMNSSLLISYLGHRYLKFRLHSRFLVSYSL